MEPEEPPNVVQEPQKVLDFLEEVMGRAHLGVVVVVVVVVAEVEEEVAGIYQDYNGNCKNRASQVGMTHQLSVACVQQGGPDACWQLKDPVIEDPPDGRMPYIVEFQVQGTRLHIRS